MNPNPSPLPYHDKKPQGAADFYFAINATFRFIHRKLGRVGWIEYLEKMGEDYFAPVNTAWRTGGLEAVADYWRAFFAAEPGAEVLVTQELDHVKIEVKKCPAIAHLKKSGRNIVPYFCQHCYFLGNARARNAGLAMRLEGGDGQCVHCYFKDNADLPPQDFSAIVEATSC